MKKILKNKKADMFSTIGTLVLVLVIVLGGIMLYNRTQKTSDKTTDYAECQGIKGHCADACTDEEYQSPIKCSGPASQLCCIPKSDVQKDSMYMRYKLLGGDEFKTVATGSKIILESGKTYQFNVFVDNAYKVQTCSLGFYDKDDKPLFVTPPITYCEEETPQELTPNDKSIVYIKFIGYAQTISGTEPLKPEYIEKTLRVNVQVT